MSLEILKELDEIDLSECDECDENDKKQDLVRNLNFLSPSSQAKVGVLADIKHLSVCLQKALETCQHRLQLLIFHEARVSVVCEICDLKEDFNGDGEQEAGSHIEDSTDTLQIEDSFDKDDSCIIVESPTGRRKSIDGDGDKLLVTGGVILSSSPTNTHKSLSGGFQEKPTPRISLSNTGLCQIEVERSIWNKGQQTKIISTSIGEEEEEVDDAEIDKLLMDSPEHNERKRGREEADTNFEDNGMTVDLQNPEVEEKEPYEVSLQSTSQETTSTPEVPGYLRLRPLSKLIPGLPQFTSQKLEAGVNPMILSGPWNTHYERDYSLEECVEETPPLRVDGIPSKSNTNVGKATVRYRVVSDGEVSRLRLSPVPGAGHQAIPNIHGIQHRQQVPGQPSQMSFLQQQPRVQLTQQQVSPALNGGSRMTLYRSQNNKVRMPSQFSEVSRSQHAVFATSNPVPGSSMQHFQHRPQSPQQLRLGQPQSPLQYTRPQYTQQHTQPQSHQLPRSDQTVARVRSGLQHQASEIPLSHDPRLPPGWRRTILRTANRESFVVISDEAGRQFRSREEIKSFVTSYGIEGIDPTKVDFSVYGQVM